MLAAPQPASACSCAGEPDPLPLEFEGEALGSLGPGNVGEVWRFRASRAKTGTAAGEVVEVTIDGTGAPGADGVQAVSSCSLGAYPTPGQRYSVGAYGGSNPDGTPRFFANVCGGFVRALDGVTPAAPPAPDPESQSSSWRVGLIGLAALLIVAGIVVRVRRLRRPSED